MESRRGEECPRPGLYNSQICKGVLGTGSLKKISFLNPKEVQIFLLFRGVFIYLEEGVRSLGRN